MVIFIYLYTSSPLLIKQQQHTGTTGYSPSLLEIYALHLFKKTNKQFNVQSQNKILTKINSNVLLRVLKIRKVSCI